jgi:hypothetical protein
VSDPSESTRGEREVGDVSANETSPLRLRRLRDAVQEYVSQRRALPEVREGVGERAEPAESAAEIQRLMAARAGRLIANRAAGFVVEKSGISRRQR